MEDGPFEWRHGPQDMRCPEVKAGAAPYSLRIEYRIRGGWRDSFYSPRLVCRECLEKFRRPETPRVEHRSGYEGWRWTVEV